MKKIFFAIGLLFALAACAPTAPATQVSISPTTSVPTTQVSVSPTTSAPTTVAPTVNSRTANLKEIVNTVQARGSADKTFQDANVGLTLNVGGQARTGENSKARLDFIEGTIVRLGPTTILTVEELATENGSPLTRFQLELGKLWIALKGGTLDIKTPAGIVSVRGSYAMIEVFKTNEPPPRDFLVRVSLLEGRGVYGNMMLMNMQGLVINHAGMADRFLVPNTFLMDFCDNNMESCQTLMGLLNIKSLDVLREIIQKEAPGRESPKAPPCTKRGC